MNGKKVLVTGSEGFIGSHLVERLVELGARVRAVVLYNFANSWGWLESLPPAVLEEVEVCPGDVRDQGMVKEALKGQEIIFHLAALIGIPYSYKAPASYVQTNVVGTLNMLEAARECGVERFIHTSTSEVYGTAVYVPIDERHPLQTQSPYAATKIAADKLAESYHRTFGLPVVTVRPFNTYGPRQSARAVIPTVITQALTSKEVKLGSLHPTRDLTFVKDTVEGFIKSAAAERAVGEVINIGSGFEISIGELARLILGLIPGCKAELAEDVERRRPPGSEVERLWADNRKARELLGWQPAYTLEKGLAETVAWFSQEAGRYKQIYNV